MNKRDLIEVRDYMPTDFNFIIASWLKSLKYSNDWFGAIDSEVYYTNYQIIIKSILGRPNSRIKIACLREDNDVILGYSVYEEDKIHFVFVKSVWRKIGLARALVPAQFNTVTHLTNIGQNIIKNHPNVKFNPFA